MLSIACVLKSGPEYRTQHVFWLAAQVKQYLTIPHRFVCLTDTPDAVSRKDIHPIRLLHDFPGWWSKVELVRRGVFDGPVLYCDLDTIICGSLDGIALGHRFTVLENFWRSDRIGSGLMAWGDGVDLSQIYARFCRESDAAMKKYRVANRWGDQAFFKDHTPIEPERWQRKYPGKIISYKRGVLLRHGGSVPPGASIICFHGVPRPWATSLGKSVYAQLADAG